MIRYSIFPKAWLGRSAASVAETIRAAGLDTCNVVIREGFWVDPQRVAATLPSFLRTMRDLGVGVHFATTPWTAADLPDREAELAPLAEHGITDVRLAQTFSGGG